MYSLWQSYGRKGKWTIVPDRSMEVGGDADDLLPAADRGRLRASALLVVLVPSSASLRWTPVDEDEADADADAPARPLLPLALDLAGANILLTPRELPDCTGKSCFEIRLTVGQLL